MEVFKTKTKKPKQINKKPQRIDVKERLYGIWKAWNIHISNCLVSFESRPLTEVSDKARLSTPAQDGLINFWRESEVNGRRSRVINTLILSPPTPPSLIARGSNYNHSAPAKLATDKLLLYTEVTQKSRLDLETWAWSSMRDQGMALHRRRHIKEITQIVSTVEENMYD